MLRTISIVLLLVCAGAIASAATFQYRVPSGNGYAYLWLPPKAESVRGLFIMGQISIEWELINSPAVRAACEESGIGIVYFKPHIDGTFKYWTNDQIGKTWLKALDDLAKTSGHSEVARVPWITAGHSTAGIFCRNVAYWQPQRTAAVVHIKSGNFWQADCKPPAPASIVGIPLVSINGGMETYGPVSGIDPLYGRETQWTYAERDLQRFRNEDPQYLVGEVVDPGNDHFHGDPQLNNFVALYLKKTALYRLPLLPLPAGDAPIAPRAMKAEDGVLIDPDYKKPTIITAKYDAYTGKKADAMWFYDLETAAAAQRWMRNLGNHQCVAGTTLTWVDEGDGWEFTAKSEYLEKMPPSFNQGKTGPFSDMKVGHADVPIVYQAKECEPVVQVAPDRFRWVHPVVGRKGGFDGVNIASYSAGDDKFRATIRFGTLAFPALKGTKQTITFPAITDTKVDALPLVLGATASSGLPVCYEVEYGPLAVVDGKLVISDLPTSPVFPIECKVNAFQIGRRIGAIVEPAAPVSVTFQLVK
ncbi:MAG: hypothetical protein WCJ56_01705 [bacterium]